MPNKQTSRHTERNELQLRRRPRLKHRPLRRHRRLPVVPILGIDLSRGLPVLGALEQRGADHVLGRVDGLVVVDVGGAVGAVVAVHRVARVAVVGVGFQLALVEAEVLARDDLVERVVGAGEVFAGAAVAVVVSICTYISLCCR